MKKVVLVLFLAVTVLFSVLLSGCSVPGASGQVTIKYWKAPHIDAEEATWKEIIAKFEKENPNIKIEYLVTPWDTWDQQYTAAFAGNSPPDVSYMTEYYPKFAKDNKIADLTSFFKDDFKKEFVPNSLSYATYKGKLCGIPYDMAFSGFMYNKDLLDKGGVQVPTTWDELVAACQKLTKDTDGDGKTDQWGIGIDLTPSPDILVMNSFILQAGTDLYNKDLTGMGFNNAEGLKGIQFVKDLMLKYKVCPPIDMYTADELHDMIYKGKVAFYPQQTQFYGEIKKNAPDGNFGIARMPAGPGSIEKLKRANYGGEGMYSMAEASKHKDEAWKFIEFLTKPENEAVYMGKAGWFSAQPRTNELMKKDNPTIKDCEVSINDAYFYPADLKFSKVMEGMRTMWEEILRESKTPEQAVTDYIKAYDDFKVN